MKQHTVIKLCSIASIGAIAFGLTLILATLAPLRSANWGEAANHCLPQALIIAAGLVSLAICSLAKREG